MNITVSGVGMTKFGELWDRSPRSLASEAVSEAIKDAGIRKNNIQALFVGNMLSGILGGQEHLGALYSDELGLFVPAMKVEGACASGGLAVHAAIQSLLAGTYDTVLVLGIEKMSDQKPELVARGLMGAGGSDEQLAGATFPGLYAILARSHMDTFGTTQKDLAAIAVKNHFHASLNPQAHYHAPITVDRVLKSACVADPLKLLDCSPISDGAAAVVLSRTHGQRSLPRRQAGKIKIIASQVATDTLSLSGRKDLTKFEATQKAAKKAYLEAGVGPGDLDLAELHDCFTIAELLAVEDIGLYKKGEAAHAISRGEGRLGSSKGCILNTSGGLKACGHPVGATGVKQIVELTRQLRGTCGARQVSGARIGLSQNVGGTGATCVVHILKREA